VPFACQILVDVHRLQALAVAMEFTRITVDPKLILDPPHRFLLAARAGK